MRSSSITDLFTHSLTYEHPASVRMSGLYVLWTTTILLALSLYLLALCLPARRCVTQVAGLLALHLPAAWGCVTKVVDFLALQLQLHCVCLLGDVSRFDFDLGRRS